MSELTYEHVAEAASGTLSGLVAGDLALRALSLRHLGQGARFPTILAARQMSAKLCFIYAIQEERRVFGFLGEKHDEKVADIRLNFSLEPSLGETGASPSPTLPSFAPPDLLVCDGDPDVLTVRMPGGKTYAISFPRDGGLTVAAEDGELLVVRKDWEARHIVELLDALAEWADEGHRERFYPLRVEAMGELGGLLQRILDGLDSLTHRLRAPFTKRGDAALDRYLRSIHPHFGAGYSFRDLHAKVLVQLNREGELARELDDEDWHQLDIEIRVPRRLGRTEAQLQLRPPDILVQGSEYHARFLACVREHWKAFHSSYVRHFEGLDHDDFRRRSFKETAFREFVWDPAQEARSLFVRIDRDDTDVVLLRGSFEGKPAELVYRVRFKVSPFPEVRVERVKEAVLIAGHVGRKAYTPIAGVDAEVHRYFVRTFRILQRWKMGIGGHA